MLVYKNVRNRRKDFFSRVTGGVKSTLFILVQVGMLPLAAFLPPSIMQNLNSVKPLKMSLFYKALKMSLLDALKYRDLQELKDLPGLSYVGL